jgi:peptidoglycan/xylan/chitin deacetylase (PgdA/CDA1 family)
VQEVKNIVKTAYSGALYHSGALATWLRVRPGRPNPWILSYHHIEPAPFEDHLRALVRHYHIVTLDACCEHLANHAPLPANSVVLTFDDGYQQLYHQLLPLLERYDAPATVFVPTGPVDSGQPLWFNRVKTLIRATTADPVRVGDREFRLGTNREAAYVAVMRHLNQQNISVRDKIIAELLDGVELPADQMARYEPLTWDQMRAAPQLVTFGAHTRTHPCLSRLSRAEAEKEILGSKARLEEMLGVPVRHFAYPFGGPGSFTEETVEIVKAAGLVSAVTTTRGACRPSRPPQVSSPHRLPRILFDGSVSGPILAARLSGLWLFLST